MGKIVKGVKILIIKSFKDILEEGKVKIEFDRYVRSHGKKPKKESGSWMFTNTRTGDGDVFISKYGSYDECVKQAIKWAKSKGYSTIYIME